MAPSGMALGWLAGSSGPSDRCAGRALGDQGVQAPRQVGAVAFQALDARLQLLPLADGAFGRQTGHRLVHLGARFADFALGGFGAGADGVGLVAGGFELDGQRRSGALELLDALERVEQARHHRGGVFELVDRLALDAGIGLGQALFELGVGFLAGLGARVERCLHPWCRGERPQHHHGAGGAPLLARIRLVVGRRAERAHHHRMLLADTLEHQVQRQVEGQVLQKQREVEALVELDRDDLSRSSSGSRAASAASDSGAMT